MTNEEKAREIANKYCTWTPCVHEYKDAALEMAAWKEQQMIKKAVEFLNDWFTDDTCNCRIPITEDAREEFFNNFKKYMED